MPDPLGQFYLGFREAEQGEAVTPLCENIKGILSENMRGGGSKPRKWRGYFFSTARRWSRKIRRSS